MNTWRVDRTSDKRVPCGMNDLLYLGDSFREARRVYQTATARPGEFILISRWSDPLREYRILDSLPR